MCKPGRQDIQKTKIISSTRFNKDGAKIETEESWWKTRYLFQYEAIHLLYRCGFEVESLAGDYNNGPVTTNSQLIFQVKLAINK
jgi:hypothetical protein